MRRHLQIHSKKGFLLMELVVAFLLLALLFSQFFGITQQKNEILKLSKERLKAMEAASSTLENLRTLSFEMLQGKNEETFKVEGLQPPEGRLPGLIQVKEEKKGLLLVQVTVEWRPYFTSKTQKYTLTTWIGKGGLMYAK